MSTYPSNTHARIFLKIIFLNTHCIICLYLITTKRYICALQIETELNPHNKSITWSKRTFLFYTKNKKLNDKLRLTLKTDRTALIKLDNDQYQRNESTAVVVYTERCKILRDRNTYIHARTQARPPAHIRILSNCIRAPYTPHTYKLSKSIWHSPSFVEKASTLCY